MARNSFFMYLKRRLNERRESEITRFGKMNIIPQIIHTDTVCRQKLEYMHNNPVVKGFVDKPEYWLNSSARNYILGDDSVLKVELLQML